MNLRIESKVCLITGAGSGIGEAIAKRYAQEGAQLILTDINKESVTKVAEVLAAEYGVKAIAFKQDVADEQKWFEVVTKVNEIFGRIDVLVNNAGIAIPGDLENTTLADWRKTHEVNCEGTFLGCQAVTRIMKNTGGSIINISSIEGIIGERNTLAYNSSKGAVRTFTKSMALHCAHHQYGIRVNSVHPGFVKTPLVVNALASLPPEEAQLMLDSVLANIPLAEMGTVEDIANGCLFLASDESRYMTGSELVMDGGYICR
ncbi:MAG: 3-beta hydroxysteroid dehydrogenase [Gammaproteobacteria bacterium]|nr:MAG: 3-beta hydroxysteroid dehydrogenase [Gammaproteobacteria bacterium]